MIKPFARNPLQIIAQTYNRPELLEMALAKPPTQGFQWAGARATSKRAQVCQDQEVLQEEGGLAVHALGTCCGQRCPHGHGASMVPEAWLRILQVCPEPEVSNGSSRRRRKKKRMHHVLQHGGVDCRVLDIEHQVLQVLQECEC